MSFNFLKDDIFNCYLEEENVKCEKRKLFETILMDVFANKIFVEKTVRNEINIKIGNQNKVETGRAFLELSWKQTDEPF